MSSSFYRCLGATGSCQVELEWGIELQGCEIGGSKRATRGGKWSPDAAHWAGFSKSPHPRTIRWIRSAVRLVSPGKFQQFQQVQPTPEHFNSQATWPGKATVAYSRRYTAANFRKSPATKDAQYRLTRPSNHSLAPLSPIRGCVLPREWACRNCRAPVRGISTPTSQSGSNEQTTRLYGQHRARPLVRPCPVFRFHCSQLRSSSTDPRWSWLFSQEFNMTSKPLDTAEQKHGHSHWG
jgi:hypothetical protein